MFVLGEADAAALGLGARFASSADRRRAFRTANLRWHPDRFVQAWGGLLAADERDAVLQRVTEVSQAINALNAEYKVEKLAQLERQAAERTAKNAARAEEVAARQAKYANRR